MEKLLFAEEQKVVYPAHGVGTVKGVETQIIGEAQLTAYVVSFDRDKMTLRIPVKRASASGLRSLSTTNEVTRVKKTLRSKAKTSRGMWSRRAKEYESKINSGNIVSLAEVVRDLHRNVDDPDRSYSERIIYENALDRLAGEISAVEEIGHDQASQFLIKTINDNLPEKKDEIQISADAKPIALDEDDFFDAEEEFDDDRAA